MTELFIPYEEAKALRDLGFNEKCLTTYLNGELETKEMFFFKHTFRSHETQEFISAPLYSQAFKWFREKHDLSGCIDQGRTINNIWFIFTISERKLSDELPEICRSNKEFKDYEQAELACLRKLIEITKQK
jgi:hypothetical protein